MKVIDFKFNDKTKQNNFCISSGEAWKLVPTKFEYDWLDENAPAFLESDNKFVVYNYIKYVKKLGFKLSSRASEEMKALSDYFQKKFNLYVAIAQLNSERKIVKVGIEL